MFSLTKVESVEVGIDGVYLGSASQSSEEPNFWVIQWYPKKYKSGLHSIKVTAKVGFFNICRNLVGILCVDR